MHPSQAIRGIKTRLLEGRRVVVGVSGSIAAVEVPRLVRELLRHGAEVRVVASSDALRIITEEALTFASGHPPIRALTGQVEHVTLLGPGEGRADLLLIAPATANTISKIAQGIDDTPVTSFASMALGGGVPMLVAPAMHAHLGANPAVRENLDRLRRWGVEVILPTESEGEEKLAPPEEIASRVVHALARGPWRGRRVVVIGGASREPIDAVRSITNESSGETAGALATQAYLRGAEVSLWAGSVHGDLPSFLVVHRWRSVGDLLALAEARAAELRAADAVLVPAALSDFTVPARAGKVPSGGSARLTLELRPTPKVLPRLRELAAAPTLLVGFKLESGLDEAALIREADSLLDRNHLDLVVANDAANLGAPRARFLLVRPGPSAHWVSGGKAEAAGRILDDLSAGLRAVPSRGAVRAATRAPPRRRAKATRRRRR